MTYEAVQRGDCKLCGNALRTSALALGPLPPCNRFGAQPGLAETHDLTVTACGHCGFVQLSEYPPASAIVPRVPWIRYNEPEAHLDVVVQRIRPLISKGGTALGIGPFDPPLLERLTASGLSATALDILAEGHAPLPGTYPYLETLQQHLRPDPLASLADSAGTADLIVCRYLLEHSVDPVQSLIGLKCLLKPQGLLVIEVPDSSKFLLRKDYSFLWEEHICYFTEDTLARMASRAGYEVVMLLRIDGLLEDLLIAVLRRGKADVPLAPVPAGALETFAAFRSEFAGTRAAYCREFDRIAAEGGQIAVFGAGHQAIMFVNALGLGDRIALFVDDDPKKAGMYVPGQTRPIVGSNAILDDPAISTCLLATSPRIADKISQKLERFLDRGGRLYSIYPDAGMATLIGPVP
jgi:SAM-dependent methyltransferase